MGDASEKQGGDPTGTYSLIPLVERQSVNPGEDIRIDVYIIGAGKIGDNQLDVIHEHPDLITDDYGSIDVRVATKPTNEIVAGDEAEAQYKTSYDLNETGGKFSFSPRYFREAKESFEKAGGVGGEQPLAFPISYLDDRHDGKAPIHYELCTADDASSGDYRLMLLFTYKSDGIIHQDRQPVSIHVKSRRERWEPIPMYAIIGGAIVGFLTLIVTALSVLMRLGTV